MAESDISPATLLECAVSAARAAGDHALLHRDRRTEAIKADRHDIKLKLDVESQEKAEEIVRATFPGHDILGEEETGTVAGPARAEAGHEWIIDPIDGTINFSHGLPLWCSSVAVRRGEDVLAGAVYSPAMGELYTATVDGKAECNGSPIRVSSVDSIAASIVTTGLDKSNDPARPPLAILQSIVSNVQRPRIMGCAALDICRVAHSQADAYFESGIFIWDVAAAGLIVRQAGGEAEILAHLAENRLMFLASNGLVHEEFKALILDAVE